MKERPLLFSGAMVLALLDGKKTQTRRIVKPQPPGKVEWFGAWYAENPSAYNGHDHQWELMKCPYGEKGSRLWVRETFSYDPYCLICEDANSKGDCACGDSAVGDYRYRADGGLPYAGSGWKPSIHMPRCASRLTLEITEVRVQRLQEISEEDALAEGVKPWDVPVWCGRQALPSGGFIGVTCYAETAPEDWFDVRQNGTTGRTARAKYAELWDEINGAGSWELNPFVWSVSFKAVSPQGQEEG